jgi:hypothetical protein
MTMMALSNFQALGAVCNLSFGQLGKCIYNPDNPSGGKQVWMHHLIEFEESMNKPTQEPTCKPINDLMIEQMNN